MATRAFKDLDKREVLALAVSLEDADQRRLLVLQVVVGGVLVFLVGILIGPA